MFVLTIIKLKYLLCCKYYRKKKDKSSKEGKRPVSNEKGKSGSDGPTDTQEEPKEAMKESEILLLQRYGTL